MTAEGRKSPLSSHGWIPSPKRRETAKTGRTACAHASGAETRERPFALTCCLARPAPQRTNVVLLCPEPNCPRIHLNYRRGRALGRECSAIGVKLGIREFK